MLNQKHLLKIFKKDKEECFKFNGGECTYIGNVHIWVSVFTNHLIPELKNYPYDLNLTEQAKDKILQDFAEVGGEKQIPVNYTNLIYDGYQEVPELALFAYFDEKKGSNKFVFVNRVFLSMIKEWYRITFYCSPHSSLKTLTFLDNDGGEKGIIGCFKEPEYFSPQYLNQGTPLKKVEW
jgi:hypothetical protein